MSDDELTITWPTISSDTSGAYDVNLDTMTVGTGENFTYGNIGLTGTVWTTNTMVGAAGSNYQFSDWSVNSNVQPGSAKITLNGANADIEVNGRSLMNAIDALEQRLNIMVPNLKMEKEWDELKQLGDCYRALEKQLKEKGDMWARLKEINK